MTPPNLHDSSSSSYSAEPECWPSGDNTITSGQFVTLPQASLLSTHSFSAASSAAFDNPTDWLLNPTSQPFPLPANTLYNLDSGFSHGAEEFLLDDSTFFNSSTANMGGGEVIPQHYGGFYPDASQDGVFAHSQQPLQQPALELSDKPGPSGTPSPSNCDTSVNPSRIEKRKQNTLAARRYRQKRVDQMQQLEDALRETERERDALKVRVARLEGETETLKQMLQTRR